MERLCLNSEKNMGRAGMVTHHVSTCVCARVNTVYLAMCSHVGKCECVCGHGYAYPNISVWKPEKDMCSLAPSLPGGSFLLSLELGWWPAELSDPPAPLGLSLLGLQKHTDTHWLVFKKGVAGI